MAASKRYFVFLLVGFFLLSVCCLPEPGKKELLFDKNKTYGSFSKTMNKGYSVAITGTCSGSTKVQINWRLEVSECAERFSLLKDADEESLRALWDIYVNHSLTGKQVVTCGSKIHLPDLSKQKEMMVYPRIEENMPDDDAEQSTPAKATSKTPGASSEDSTSKQASTSPKQISTSTSKPGPRIVLNKKTPNAPEQKRRTKREADTDPEDDNNDDEPGETESEDPSAAVATDAEEPTNKAAITGATTKKADKKKTSSDNEKGTTMKKADKKKTSSDDKKADNQVCVTRRDGVFLLIVNAYPVDEKKSADEETSTDKAFQLTLNVEMKGKHGYLSASDWPLYPFYGCMSLLYVFYGVVWLVVSACQWRDLLRIQFWIGGVIALGMLEKAVFFSEYNNINITGETSPGLTIFAELVSCVKRTLARILVIIVSMGFGIVKPRLGATLHRVLGVGALYFILATVEGCFRALHPKSDPGRQQLIASIPLAVLDASICWWIFMSLVQTTRTLRIRRNLVKLSLYRHFTNTLIFAVLASVAYMIWSIKTHRFAKDGCITDWSELWLDEAFWHFLFSIVLLVIMVLWRPTANNQRYAFTPIVDFGDDDDEDDDNMTLSDAFDGMKMRNVKNIPEVVINGDTKRKHKPEDDLRWVEENIPSSAADAVLPSVLDSDEELMTTKFEMSKME